MMDNIDDQDQVDFFDEELEDVEKLTDDEFFDVLEKDKQKQNIQKIIDKVLKEKV